jgi:hypothetical protein
LKVDEAQNAMRLTTTLVQAVRQATPISVWWLVLPCANHVLQQANTEAASEYMHFCQNSRRIYCPR